MMTTDYVFNKNDAVYHTLLHNLDIRVKFSVARWVGLKVHKILLKSSCFKKKVHVHKILLDLERMCQFFLRYVFFF